MFSDRGGFDKDRNNMDLSRDRNFDRDRNYDRDSSYNRDNGYDRDYPRNFNDPNNRDAYAFRNGREPYPRNNEQQINVDRFERRDMRENRGMGFNDKIKNLFSRKDSREEEPQEMFKENEASLGSNMIIYSPKSYLDVKKLIDYLRNNEPIIVDLAEMKQQKGQRILDFLSGAIYALRGNMHKISGSIYLLTPYGLNIMVPTELKDKLEKKNG